MLFMRGIFLSLFLLSFLATAEAKEELIFLISPMTSPISTLTKFHPLVDYLEKRLGKRIKLKQKKTYKAVNELLKEGKAHFAHLCTGGYLMGRKEFNIELLAIPVIKGKKTYRAYIITHQKASYRSIEDLKGTVFAFTDPLSLTGHLFIKAYLKQRAQKPEEYFKKFFFTGSHEKSIEAVALGLAQGATIDGLVYEEMMEYDNPYAKRVKVIYKSQEFGMPPFVVSASLSQRDKIRLLRLLLNMHKDPEGKEVLKKIGIDRFDPPDHSLYRTAWEVINKAE
ncbi:MAG: phosphate/phosphite/phosphonate ABC transporter substrate-binding protein [Caldimicrobium sp.]|nr:phosphate/phosphite/phosphonate ABC transporter substrate-binding protein [Caldimicrobium sp.]MCX7873941.1 phosphate/phosphite/phosphonate ABC transporter substrate-binding protein [Caldimicrobium sp.]MDW8094220.1 phosphate/phosphite/phosphonate ABC transporter substrate-binding protein [Caldimicrobium sp.]